MTPSDSDAGASVIVARIVPDGSPDPAFGSDGLTEVPLATGELAQVRRVVATPDGGVAVLTLGGALIRLLADGQLDPAFGVDGVLTLPSGGMQDGGGTTSTEQDDLAALPDGSFAVRDNRLDIAPDVADDRGFISLLGPDGSTANGAAGTLRVAPGASLRSEPDGGLLIAGDSRAGVQVVSPAGHLQAGFGPSLTQIRAQAARGTLLEASDAMPRARGGYCAMTRSARAA